MVADTHVRENRRQCRLLRQVNIECASQRVTNGGYVRVKMVG